MGDGWFGALAVVLVLAVVLAVTTWRRGWLYRSPRFLQWRRAKSRRDRGKVRAEGPSAGGTDPTSGAF